MFGSFYSIEQGMLWSSFCSLIFTEQLKSLQISEMKWIELLINCLIEMVTIMKARCVHQWWVQVTAAQIVPSYESVSPRVVTLWPRLVSADRFLCYAALSLNPVHQQWQKFQYVCLVKDGSLKPLNLFGIHSSLRHPVSVQIQTAGVKFTLCLKNRRAISRFYRLCSSTMEQTG